MRKGRLIVIALGIAVVVAVGVAVAFTSIVPKDHEVKPTGTTEGQDKVINIEEKLGISEKSSP